MKASILHADIILLEGSVLHLRREGVRDRVTKDAKTDWRIDITRRFTPIFEISERVTLGHSFLFFHSAEQCRCSDSYPKNRTRSRAQGLFIPRPAVRSSGRTARARALSPSPPTYDKDSGRRCDRSPRHALDEQDRRFCNRAFGQDFLGSTRESRDSNSRFQRTRYVMRSIVPRLRACQKLSRPPPGRTRNPR